MAVLVQTEAAVFLRNYHCKFKYWV